MSTCIYRWLGKKRHQNGGSGVYILVSDGRIAIKSVPTGVHCTNYKAALKAIKEALKLMLENYRQAVWSSPTDQQTKLWRTSEDLDKTNSFIHQTGDTI
ncbi:hypothetical protein ElyMa_004274900 [Elysia marginata]|uniref:RNase H type-1 domain-containing protein n=1 Tax=Elysia marginata TaxID=1093978 RepID=A0AAV4GXR9_9GAST|nr:hypothetical protein ElyMa_004274900 [Elysia marginata]